MSSGYLLFPLLLAAIAGIYELVIRKWSKSEHSKQTREFFYPVLAILFLGWVTVLLWYPILNPEKHHYVIRVEISNNISDTLSIECVRPIRIFGLRDRVTLDFGEVEIHGVKTFEIYRTTYTD